VLLLLLASIAGALPPIQSVQAAEAWRTAPALPAVREALAATTGADGTIYAIGGLDGSFVPQSTVYSYKPGVDTNWQTAPSLPSARDSLAAAVSADGTIYAIGGEDSLGEPQSTVYSFRPGVDTQWQSAPSLPLSLTDLAAAAGSDGTIYAIGGSNRQSSLQNKVYTFRPGTDTQWNQAPALPSALQRLAATSVGSTIYVIGGFGLNSQNTVYRYTPGVDTVWQAAPALPATLDNLAATTANGTIYAIGGLNGDIQDKVYRFTPGVDTQWYTAPSLPAPLEFLAATTDAGGTIYAIGGMSTNSAPLSTVYSFTPTLQSTEQLDQSQTNTNVAGTSAIFVLNSIAQTFTAGITGGLDRVGLNLTRIGSVSDDLIVGIYPTSGGKPVTSGAPLARAAIHAADVPVSAGGYEATIVDASFSTPVPIVAGTMYAIVATSSVPSSEDTEGAQLNYYGWSVHAPVLGQSDNYAGGDTFQNTDFGGGFAGWIDENEDQTFVTFVLPKLAPQTRHVTSCADSGPGTLRAQISAARAGDTIVYDQDCTTTLTTGTLTINQNLTIDGSGHAVILDGNNAVTVFVINSGASASISGLTIQHGNGASTGGNGGGIANQGTLTLTGVTLQNNTTPGYGGGIRNDGTLTIQSSALIDNSAMSSGGGIINHGTATVVNSTFAGNMAESPGGAILNGDTLTVTSSTFVNNSANAGGGISNDILQTVTLNNVIIANSTGGNLATDFQGVISGDHNLIDDDTVSLISGSDNLNQSPLLGPLGAYGGPTQTIPLLPGSPAIDAGDDTTCATTGPGAVNGVDQRGITRPQGNHCDIGAFESQGFTFAAVSGSTPQSTAINTDFVNPLAVTITANDPLEPVNDGIVSYTVNPVMGVGATLSAATATISDGTASVTATANGLEGSYTVTAAIPGLTPVTFNLTNSEPPDVTPPTTTTSAVLAGTSTAYSFGTWTNQGVTVTLSASDVTAATDDTESGVAHTYYQIDSGSQQTYATPFTISDAGDHVLTVWSVDNASNNETPQTFHVMIDLVAPTTTADAAPYTFGGWTNQSVTVVLDASDNSDGSAVARTYYTLDNGSQQTYSAPFAISAEGDHPLTFWSVDIAGNIESSQTVHIEIDLTNPTITFSGNQGNYTVDQTVTIHCTASDSLSGLASTTCADITGSAVTFGVGPHSFSATATDAAGNVGTATTSFTVTVTASSLSDLTEQYASNSRVANQLSVPLTLVRLADRINNDRLKTAAINTYIRLVNLEVGHGLTPQQAAALTQLAREL
jgi:N-acetylneuraminic acid mutarotase